MAEQPTPKIGDSSVAALVPVGVRQDTPPIPLTRPFILIGSRTRAHLHLVSKTISRSHACLIRGEQGYHLRDLASRTGIIVNGRRVKETGLRDGDNIEVGSFRFRYSSVPAPKDTPAPTPEAALLSVDAGKFTRLDAPTFLIGRRGKADISLTSRAVSKSHALLFQFDGRYHIRDLGSRTGTLVNGNPVRQHALEFGDEIKIGDTTFRYRPADPQPPARAVDDPPQATSQQPTAPPLQQPPPAAEDPAAVEPPIETDLTAVTPQEPEVTPPPQRQADTEDSSPSADFTPAPVPQDADEIERGPGLDSEDYAEPDDSEDACGGDDESGRVPMRGPDGQPLFIKMRVPTTLDYFPALWSAIGPTPGNPDRHADQSP